MPWLALGAIVAVAAYLRFALLSQVAGNPFYDAAVHTMSQSWHAFLFGGYEPSGTVSVDKPPVDLWFQVLSVKLFGFNPGALKLPQALAGTLTVPLVFDIVRRGFGAVAGLAAAAALAVLPVAVLTARSDTMDTFMAFLLVLAAWLIVLAIERRRLVWLLLGGVAIALAFNVKLFEALLPAPALALLWFIGSSLPARRRVTMALATTALALVVGFAWIVPVALTPRSQRPYPIGSTNGSIWNLIFVFNGVDRLKGRPVTTPDTLPAGSHVSSAILAHQKRRAPHSDAGIKRLFGRRLGPRIGSELFPALLTLAAGALLAIVAAIRRRRALPDRLAGALAISLGVWTALGALLFSESKAFHPRYFEAISPAVAAVLGGGLCVLILRAGKPGRVAAAAVLGVNAFYASRLVGDTNGARIELAACALVALGLLVVAWRAPRRLALPVAMAIAAVASVLVVPTLASREIVHARSYDAERSGAMPPSWPRRFNRYLAAHRNGTRYSFASISPGKAAALLAAKPQPVLMLTSYRSRPLMTVAQLAQRVRTGQVRYFLIGRRCTDALLRNTAACGPTAHWAIAHSRDVTPALHIGHTGLLYEIQYCSPVTAQAQRQGQARAQPNDRGRNATRSSPQQSAPTSSRSSPARCVQRRRA